jgi:hypothetical protein
MSKVILLKMGRKQLLAVIAFLLGIGVILTLSIGLRSRPDVKSAVAANCISRDSLSKFQWARTVEELNGAFGPAESHCRPLTIAALDALNRVDVYLLIPLYALFYSVAALALGQ